MNNIARHLSGLGATPTIPQAVFTPAVAHFNTAIARINAGSTTTPAPPPVYTGGGGSTKDGRDIILPGGTIKADMRGLGGFINGLFGLGSTAQLDQQIKETLAFATQFYNQIRSQYGDEGFLDPKVEAVIEGVSAIVGPHYMGIDNKVHRITQVISEENADAVLKPLTDQLRNMTDDDARTDEWKKEENTLFAKTAMYFHPDYAKYKDAFEAEIFGRAGHSKDAESWNFFNEGSLVPPVIALGHEILSTHPVINSIWEAAKDWRGEQSKFKITDVLGGLVPLKLLARYVLKNEKLATFTEKANNIILKVAIVVAGVVLSPLTAGLSNVAAGLLVGAIAKLEYKAPVIVPNFALTEQRKQELQNQKNQQLSQNSGIQASVVSYFDDLVNLRPTTANIVSGVGAAAFLLLLLMGGNEQKKMNSKNPK